MIDSTIRRVCYLLLLLLFRLADVDAKFCRQRWPWHDVVSIECDFSLVFRPLLIAKATAASRNDDIARRSQQRVRLLFARRLLVAHFLNVDASAQLRHTATCTLHPTILVLTCLIAFG